jgi:outer membrane protein TolC
MPSSSCSSQRRAWALSRRDHLVALSGSYKALGGGWQTPGDGTPADQPKSSPSAH